MSTTTLIVFQAPSWDAVVYREWPASWGWAAFVWQVLLERYGDKIPGVDFAFGGVGLNIKNWPKLWEHENEIPFEPWERNVLRLTYNRAVIGGLTRLARIAGDLQRFQTEHWRAWDGVCHLGAIGRTIETLIRDMGHTWVPTAIGLQPTSVAADMWRMPTGEREETRPYNLRRDDLHHEVEMAPLIVIGAK